MSDRADVIAAYLPADFAARLPAADWDWRGRTVLFLWALGYPLEMAWAVGLADDPEQVSFYRESLDRLPDNELAGLLDASADRRGDGSHLTFASFGQPDDVA